jgi:hypothetical protein
MDDSVKPSNPEPEPEKTTIQTHERNARNTAGLSISLSSLGLFAILGLLAFPSAQFPDSENPVDCRPVAEWGINPEDTDFSGDRPGAATRDSCDQKRQSRLATAVILAVPTAIAGSVGVTALVFRRRLSEPEEAKRIEDGRG